MVANAHIIFQKDPWWTSTQFLVTRDCTWLYHGFGEDFPEPTSHLPVARGPKGPPLVPPGSRKGAAQHRLGRGHVICETAQLQGELRQGQGGLGRWRNQEGIYICDVSNSHIDNSYIDNSYIDNSYIVIKKNKYSYVLIDNSNYIKFSNLHSDVHIDNSYIVIITIQWGFNNRCIITVISILMEHLLKL